ncbi:hypothetical protein [Nocardia brasiliensis]|uniref:hypothetical protein n=1 Tax=Nocardia brasiliensis TaxID=37326 RepID=UPI00366C0CD3
MDGSAELYVELLRRVAALLPDVAAEIRREVARGGREVELYDPSEAWVMDSALSTPEEQFPDTAGEEYPDDLIVAKLPEELPQSDNDRGPRPDMVRPLSGDLSLETLLEALITLLKVVDGSEKELTNFLHHREIRSVAFGAPTIRQDRIVMAETNDVPMLRAQVQEDLSELLAELREQR